MIIYEPRGKAREYSPLAANLYSGCTHGCTYCYVPNVIKVERQKFDSTVEARKNILAELEKDCKKLTGTDKQVLMSFTTDPYNPFNDNTKLTKFALKMFLFYKIPIAILTKSGMRALQDLELFKMFNGNIKIGASLTCDNDPDSEKLETNAAMPEERLAMLKILHEHKIKTWVSFEPIIYPEQTLNLLKQSVDYVDQYMIGKLSGDKRDISWKKFLNEAVPFLRKNKKDFYIKETLAKEADTGYLTKEETDMNRLNLKNNFA